MMSYNGVSVILCCHNGASRLPETLGHLAAQLGIASNRLEIIVVDNGSTDGTADVARDSWATFRRPPGSLRVISEPKLGLMNARLAGIAAARFQTLSFIDDDNRVNPYWCARVQVLMHQHPTVGLIGGLGRAVFDENAAEPFWFERFQRGFAVGPQAEHEGLQTGWRDSFYGAGLTMRREAVESILARGFAPLLTGRSGSGLGAGEDSELCLALALDGWRLCYEPRLTFDHLMTTGRLNTDYLVRMYDGFGYASVALDAYVMVARFGVHVPAWAIRTISSLKHIAARRTAMKTELKRHAAVSELDQVVNEVDAAYVAGRLRGLAELRSDLPRMVERIRSWLVQRPTKGGTPDITLKRVELGG